MDFLRRLKESPLIFDGAMGTMIYARGVFINTCYDELNLTQPALIRGIHAEYVEAGADVIETNTFGANAIKLGEYGIAERVEEINAAAVRLAREAAGSDRFVAGAVGPCLSNNQSWIEAHRDRIAAAFAQQIGALTRAGVDVILLETFVHPEEIAVAAAAARAGGRPVIASFVIQTGGLTALGGRVEALAAALDANDDVDVIGVNCGGGPAAAFEALELLMPIVRKPVIAMPNAGLPQTVGGRTLYLSTPEYFTEYAKRFIALGVRGVGGCCGTTPEHIRVAAKAIRALSGVKRHIEVRAYAAETAGAAAAPAEKKSRLAAAIVSGRKVSSIELLPPRDCDLTPLLERARQCAARGVDAINIPDGPRASARVSPMVTAEALRREAGIEPILHYCCRDRNLIGMQSDLLGAQVAGIRNILIITGDPPKLGDYPDATGVFDVDSIGLTTVAANLNRGRDIGGNPFHPPTTLFLGVGANPCAIAPELELARFRAKMDAGAEFAITQPVFDPESLLRFLDRVESGGRRIPVLAGVWPLVSFKNAEFMRNEVPGVSVPDAVLERMRARRTREDSVREGIAIAREICARIAERVAGFQVSAPFGRVDIALETLAPFLPRPDGRRSAGEAA